MASERRRQFSGYGIIPVSQQILNVRYGGKHKRGSAHLQGVFTMAAVIFCNLCASLFEAGHFMN